MKFFKKFSALLLLLFTMVTMLSSPVKANSVYVQIDHFTGQWHLSKAGEYVQQGKFVPNDGNPYAFCIQPYVIFEDGWKPTVDFVNYDLLTPDQKNRIQLIDYYVRERGAATSDYWYMIGQYMIWDSLDYTFYETSGQYMYGLFNAQEYLTRAAEVNADIWSHSTVPSFDGSTHTMKLGESIQLTDTNNVLSRYQGKLTVSPNLQISQNGNVLTITAIGEGQGTISGKKVANENVGTSLVYMGAGSSQNVAYTKLQDPIFMDLNINILSNGNLDIAKVGPEGEPVPNTTFNVSSNADMSNPLTVTTNNQGIGSLPNLTAGRYYVQEISVPAPYVLNSTVQPVDVVGGQTTTFNLVNETAKGQFSIHKTDSEINTLNLAGAEYEIKNDASEVVGTLITDAQGNATSPLLGLGTYTYQETKAPAGYQLDPTVHTVTLTYADMNTPVVSLQQEVTNDVIKGKIQIVKVNSRNEEQPVANAVFEVLRLPERTVVETITTNSDGFAFTSDLRTGDYILKEIAAPQEFYLNPNEYPVSIVNHDETVVQYIVNDEIQISLEINKTNSDTNESLEGAIFEVTNKETGEVIEFQYLNENYEIVSQTQLVTNAQGKAYTRGTLPFGTYLLSEIFAPKGFVRAEPIEFTIDRNTTTVELEVIGKTTTIEVGNEPTVHHLIKHNVLGEPIEGAELELHDDQGTVLMSWTSSLEPVVVKGLEIGRTYTLVETKAPAGYLQAEPVNFTVEETAVIIEIIMVDEYIPTLNTTLTTPEGGKLVDANEQVTLVDVIDYRDVVIGQTYKFKGSLINKDTLEVVATNEVTFVAEATAGQISLDFVFNAHDLKGSSVVAFEDMLKVLENSTEKPVAEHKDINDEGQTVRIKEEIRTTATPQPRNEATPELVTIRDEVQYTHLVVGKEYTLKGVLMDKASEKPLLVDGKEVRAEHTFTPTEAQGSVFLDFTFDSKALRKGSVVVFEDLYDGELLVTSHADINDEGQTVNFVEIAIRKVDSLDKTKVLKNAEFTLYQNDLAISRRLTDNDGIARFVVEEGTYTLKETKAPAGYKLSEDVVEITLTGDEPQHIYEVTALNTPLEDDTVKKFPDTGAESLAQYFVSGSIFLGLGAALLIRRKKED